MRLKLAILSYALLLPSSATIAQIITPVPIPGASRVFVKTDPAKPGDTIVVYATKADTTCGPKETAIPLLDNSNDKVLPGGTTPIEFKAPLENGQILCAITDSKEVGATRQVTVGNAQPTQPVITAAPISGSDYLTITTAPAQDGFTIAVFAMDKVGPCDSKVLLHLLDGSDNLVLPQPQTAVLMTNEFVVGEFVCAVLTSPDGKTVYKTTSIAVVASSKPDATVVKPNFQGSPIAGSLTLTLAGQPGSGTALATAPDPKAAVIKATADASTAAAAQSDAKIKLAAASKLAAEAKEAVSTANKTSKVTDETATSETATKIAAADAATAETQATQASAAADAKAIAAAQTAADAKANVIIAVYQFPPAFLANTAKPIDCTADIVSGTPLSIVTGTTTSYSTSAPSSSPYSITLSQPLTAGTVLCFTQTINGATSYSHFAEVIDPTDYGRFTAIFTAGATISNQQQSSNSTTAGEYLDMKLNDSWVYGGRRPCASPNYTHCKSSGLAPNTVYYQGNRFLPGFDTYFDARLSQLPVATTTNTAGASTTTTTSTGTTTTTTPATSNLNLLTSQQGLKVMIGSNLPFRTSGWNKRSNAFTIGPTVKASFDTLLNPTVTSASNSAPTTGSFSSVYHSWAAGIRSSWDQFPISTDKSPKTFAEFDVLFGEYSNLPSYECVGSSKGGKIQTGTPTSCNTSITPNVSRTLVPRLNVVGFVNFPGYPFVLGFDANLAQYAFRSPENVDTLNKPGNDVRIYIGYTVDLATAFKMLKK